MNEHETLVHFDKRAKNWNELYQRPQFLDRLSLFVNGIKKSVKSHSRILDYGCGTGRIAIELAACGYLVTGVDGSSGMIKKARLEAENRNLTSVTFQTINPTTWHPQEQYDAVVCSSVIEYVYEDKLLLSHFAEAVKPGGTLLISAPYAFSIVGILEDVIRLSRHMITIRELDVQFSHRRYTRSAFAQMLENIGFETPVWTSFELPVLNQLGVCLSRIPFLGVMMLAHTHRHKDESNHK